MELCALTGVCTKQQVARMVGISEREADHLLRQIASFHTSEEAGGGAILEVIPLEQGYWKRRGASPIVYRRGPGATAFLRDRTGQDIRPCELARPDQVVHALCIVDAALQLREMGYKVQVEQQAGLGRGSIRFDLLVETSEGLLDIEVEQCIGADHIPRIRRLLQERNRLFSSPQGRTFARRVLVLFNIPRAEWPRMQRIWRQAIATMEERPAIEVWGMLLSRFGECMNLQERSGWVNLTEPVAVDRERAQSEALVKTLPDTLRRAADLLGDRIILTAFLQDFQEQAERSVDDFLSFARLIEGIAAPSLWGHIDGPTGAEMPRASLYLLRRYLEMYPQLHQILKRRMLEGAELNRWSVAMITTRIRGIVRDFLGFFGLCPDRGLVVRVHLPDYDRDQDEVHLSVRMESPWPGDGEEETYTGIPIEEPARFEHALAFVLQLLLWYPGELGLRRPPYL